MSQARAQAALDRFRKGSLQALPPLPREVMAQLLERLTMRAAPAGADIVIEGEPGEAMFVVVSGRAEVVHGGQVIASLGEGAVFGEIAQLAWVPRLATVRAVEDSLLVEVPRNLMRELQEKNPALRTLVRDFFVRRLLDNILRVNDLFAGFSPEELLRIAGRFQLQQAARGDTLIRQHTPGKGLFLILRGRCVAYDETSGEEYPEMREGAVFGEISLIESVPATATVRAEAACVLLFLDRESFLREVSQNEDAMFRFGSLVQERLARTVSVRSQFGPALV